MAKGRKLTTSQSERFLGSYGYGYANAVNESPELGEEDVWSTVDDDVDYDIDRHGDEERIVSNSYNGEWSPRAAVESGGGISIRGRRRRGEEERHVGGLSLAFESSGMVAAAPRILHQFQHRGGGGEERRAARGGEQMATSAPVNVPDWSKIYRVESVESMHEYWGEEAVEEGAEMVPPHEYLARGRRTGTTSVFEGVGRTLKGRDLRRVRDAVWSQTGFDG